MRRIPKITWILALYAVLAIASAATQSPWWDEGIYADPSSNLAFHGKLIITTWHLALPGTPPFPGLDRYTFMEPPGYLLVEAAAFRILGFSVFAMRSIPLLSVLGLIWVWFEITRRLTGSTTAGLLTALMLAADNLLILVAATGRPDAFVAVLGDGAILVYLHWRDRSLPRAVAYSAVPLAYLAITHPMGLLQALKAVVFMLALDGWKLIRPRPVALFAMPFLVALAAWGVYILQAPDLFRGQFIQHLSYRAGGASSPLKTILGDFHQRYLSFYWTTMAGAGKLRVLVLAAYVGSYLALLLLPAARRRWGAKPLLWTLPITYAALAVLDNYGAGHYLAFCLPLYACCLGIVGATLYESRDRIRTAVWLVAGGVAALQCAGILVKVRANPWKNTYDPVIAYITSHTKPDELVFGPVDLMFGLGRSRPLDDDSRLGLYTGRRANVIVHGRFQQEAANFDEREPATAAWVRGVLSHYDLVMEKGDYQVYQRRD